MKHHHRKWLSAGASAVCVSLLILSTPAAADQATNSRSQGEAQPAAKTAADSKGEPHKTGTKHEDILDRAFSPLDRAVSDINRDINEDINKEDDSAAPEPAQ
jgi:hypothetical protein